mgnify:CR=1 FL=1
MTLAELEQINKDARSLPIMSARFVTAKDDLNGIFVALEAMADRYDGVDVDKYNEIIGKITLGKSILQTMLNNH